VVWRWKQHAFNSRDAVKQTKKQLTNDATESVSPPPMMEKQAQTESPLESLASICTLLIL
jgi:hypothetical protein